MDASARETYLKISREKRNTFSDHGHFFYSSNYYGRCLFTEGVTFISCDGWRINSEMSVRERILRKDNPSVTNKKEYII